MAAGQREVKFKAVLAAALWIRITFSSDWGFVLVTCQPGNFNTEWTELLWNLIIHLGTKLHSGNQASPCLETESPLSPSDHTVKQQVTVPLCSHSMSHWQTLHVYDSVIKRLQILMFPIWKVNFLHKDTQWTASFIYLNSKQNVFPQHEAKRTADAMFWWKPSDLYPAFPFWPRFSNEVYYVWNIRNFLLYQINMWHSAAALIRISILHV